MKLLVGLGNPGSKYINNRHNAGYMFIDYLKKEFVNQNLELRILKTDRFMNESGSFVKKLISKNKKQKANLWVAHDDLDIPLGKFKIDKGTGPKVHNGLTSIENALGNRDFWRIRIGVDNRPAKSSPEPAKRVEGEVYVLQDFTDDERKILNLSFPKIVKLLQNEYKILSFC